jgi:hypothetical protein
VKLVKLWLFQTKEEAMFMMLYHRADGTQVCNATFNTMKDALLDLAHETVNPEIVAANLIHQVDLSVRWVLLKWDREGLHLTDIIGSIEALGTEPFRGFLES